jgi:arylsulfatase A-like enzyme
MRFLLVAAFCSSLLCALPSVAAEKPNVVVIMADDLGYGDLSAYGATAFQTPHIDRLAAGGRRFTSGYSTASTCTPTRYSFLTGSYAFRRKGTGIAPPNGHLVVPPDAVTVADLARTAGYRTAVIGKWHLGLGAEGKGPDWNGSIAPGPREIGFDYNFLLPTTNDRVPQVFVEGDRVVGLDPRDPLWVGDRIPSPDHPTGISHRDTLKMNWSHGHNGTIHNGISRIGFYTGGHAARFRDEDLADAWAAKADAWLEANRSQPFFLFLASHDLHVPRMPHERFQGKSGLGFRADSILQLDWQVGELMKTLDRLGLAEKTLIVLCSDNGPVMDDGYQDSALEKRGSHRAAGPYRGRKVQRLRGRHPHPFHHLLEGPHRAGRVRRGGLHHRSRRLLRRPHRHAAAGRRLRRQRRCLRRPARDARRPRAEGTSSSRTTEAAATLVSAPARGNWSAPTAGSPTISSSRSAWPGRRCLRTSSLICRRTRTNRRTCWPGTPKRARN